MGKEKGKGIWGGGDQKDSQGTENGKRLGSWYARKVSKKPTGRKEIGRRKSQA